MTNDLKNHLKSNPQISHVYVNDKNEWQFHKRAGYDQVLTRNQLLATKTADEKVEDDKAMLFTQAGKLTDAAADKAKDTDEQNIEDQQLGAQKTDEADQPANKLNPKKQEVKK